MVRFYQSVDLRSRKTMIYFLINHFRYYTANSWNGSCSYACNLKITKLGLNTEIVDKLLDMIQIQEFFYGIDELLDAFNHEHNYCWQAAMNGRSGGYLVLYQGFAKQSEYKSFCTSCGQRNYTSIEETGTVCGRCKKPHRVNYINPPLTISTYSGRSTDEGEDFSDWDIADLRERVRLIQEFDTLADSIVDYALNCTQNFVLKDETIFVPQTQKRLVPII